MSRRLIITISVALLLVLGTYTAIQFGKGYRPDLKTKEIKGTGLLVATSLPEGAQVFINGKLTTATDDTLNLPPDEYEIEIKKDGYIPWKKTMQIQAELVTQANARLFPSVTSLYPLTFTGASNLVPSPDGQKIVYAVTQSSEESNKGLWILDLVERPLSLSKKPRQVVRNTPSLDFSQAVISWSQDSSQILAHFPPDPKNPRSTATNILLDANNFNRAETLRDVTAQLPVLFSQWEEQLAIKTNNQLLNLPEKMQNIATASATNVYFSPDEKSMLYKATQEVEIPEELIPPLPATSTQPEERQLKPGNVYVYDIEEDKNFLIAKGSFEKEEPAKIMLVDQITPRTLFSPESSPSAYRKLQEEQTSDTIANFRAQYTPVTIQSIQWFPDSKHLIITEDNKISIVEYDGTNTSQIYSGMFNDGLSYPWPDGSKMLILTNLNQESDMPSNLYAMSLE